MNSASQKLIKFLAAAILVFIVSTGQSAAQTPAFPNAVVDDNGHYGFVREVVPLLLGRKPRGAREVKLLGDLAEITSRSTVLQLLMSTDEFHHHWADTFLDMLRLQRAGLKRQRDSCFEQAKLSPVPPQLATFIAGSSATLQWSGNDFNMKDVAVAAFKADRIDALQRAYLYPFTMNGGRNYNEQVYKSSQGEDFSHTYLNRNMRCFSCHNEVTSTSDAHTDWDRHWPIEIWSDKVLFGVSAPGDAGKMDNIFRFDQTGNENNEDLDRLFPWGIDESCADDTYYDSANDRRGFVEINDNSNHDVDFAGEAGNNLGIKKIEEVLRQGIDSLKTSGLQLTPGAQNAFPEPSTPEQALAYTVAVSTVNLVWEKLMGENLTIANYFSRNQSQRDALWHLTVETFIPDWSVKTLIETILLTTYTARRSPEISAQTGAYQLPTIINPWVARDPRAPNAPPVTDLNTRNGQGEIVRAHTKRTAMRQASAALDVSSPNLFGGGRYSFDTQLEFGQFMSTSQPGLDGFDIQSMLAWEDTNGLCQGSPWMEKLMIKIAEYDAATPLLPLSLLDVVKTIRDWLLQDARVEVSGTMEPNSHELAALGAIFSVNNGQPILMNTPAATFQQFTSAAELGTRLNEVCGAYISSPQFLMTGISLAQPLEIPDFNVCNGADDSCDYQPMCEDYEQILSSQLSTYVSCNADSVVPEDPPDSADPPVFTTCQFHPHLCEDNLIPSCFEDLFNGGQFSCPIDINRCDPRCGGFDLGMRFDGGRVGDGRLGFPGEGELGLRCCGGRPGFDRRDPDSVISWLEGALILEAQGAEIINLFDQQSRILTSGEKLKFGDVISMPPGSRMIMEIDGEKIDVGGKRGVPSVFARTNSRQFTKVLREVADRGDNRLVRKMLSSGLSPDTIMPSGESLLNWSIRRGDSRLSSDLINAGADINRVDARGNTPMTSAHHFGHERVISTLQKSGALPLDRKSKYREKPLAHKIMVTGPSAVKAPHPAGDKYFSEIQWRGLDVKPKPTTLDEQKKHVLETRKIQNKRAKISRKTEAKNQDVNVEFPLPEKASRNGY